MIMEKETMSCVDCGALHCSKRNSKYPDFCLTVKLEEEEIQEMVELYTKDEENHRVTTASAEVEAEFYCQMTRIQEVMEFAKRIGAKKLGIATCVGLMDESRIVAQIFRKKGFEVYGVACKVGAIKKETVGIKEQYIMAEGEHMCNPILQAKLLNEAKTDLNVVMGLCVGHDSLFYKYAEGLCTTLVTKDRVLGHNPVAAIYTAKGYYSKKLF